MYSIYVANATISRIISENAEILTEESNYVYDDDLGYDKEGVLPTPLVEPIMHAHIYISDNKQCIGCMVVYLLKPLP